MCEYNFRLLCLHDFIVAVLQCVLLCMQLCYSEREESSVCVSVCIVCTSMRDIPRSTSIEPRPDGAVFLFVFFLPVVEVFTVPIHVCVCV